MAILEGGTSGTIAGVGSQAAQGLHIIAKPQDAGTLGHYAVSVQTGSMAAGLAASSEIFQLRWTDATRVCVITEVSCNGLYATTAFAAGAISFNLSICRSWTVDGSGGTLLTLSGDNQNLRAAFGASLIGAMRIAQTAALTAGTKTNDAHATGLITSHSSGGTGSATPIIGNQHLPTTTLFRCDMAGGEYPIALVQNEGITIRATVPATGVWTAGFTIKWMELAAF